MKAEINIKRIRQGDDLHRVSCEHDASFLADRCYHIPHLFPRKGVHALYGARMEERESEWMRKREKREREWE